jgi:hypothetical protein
MEPGFKTEDLTEGEVEGFWQKEPSLELEPTPCVPEAQTSRNESRPRAAHYRQGQGPVVFQEASCHSRDWSRTRAESRVVVDRIWVYKYESRYSSIEKGSESLFVVFAKPFSGGITLPTGLASISQDGRWEYLNPRTICFRPESGRVTASDVQIYGELYSVYGGESE